MGDLEKTFRKFTIGKLEALKVVTGYSNPVVSATTISGALAKVGQELGGTLSSLSRTKIEDQPLLLSVGRSPDEGTLWRLNEGVAPKDKVRQLVETILEENKEYRIAINKKR